jgi:cytochrome c oxidase subunit 3/cytochrome o ubiquinol oxidase subunit 3
MTTTAISTTSMSERRGTVAVLCLIAAEAAIFTIFVVAYLYYIGKSVSGPQPADVLRTPIAMTVCLLASSLTVHASVKALGGGNVRAFTAWWLATLALAVIFLAGTGIEWHRLITVDGLTIATNLFGTTYYSLVGLHAFHVAVGVVILMLGSMFALLGYVTPRDAPRSDTFSLYWHFVDAVWVVVFLVVYVIGR